MNDVAIIFDMDGLMVDTEPLARQAWDATLAPYGRQLDDVVYNRMIGHRTDASARMVLEVYALPLTAVELVRRKQALMLEICADGVPVMPGLVELHAAIAKRELSWGVATSSPRTQAEAVLRQLGLREACGAIAAGDEVAHGKPAPDIYLLASERLHVAPARCLALEDSGPGCLAAHRAGMMVAAVPHAATASADFTAADVVYASLHEVVENLDALVARLARRG